MTEAMLAVGKAESEKAGLKNIRFVQGDAEFLPFADGAFDIVISRLAFHHFTDPKRCFTEMARVLRPGSKLVIIDMETAEEALRQTEDETETMRDPSHVRNRSRDERRNRDRLSPVPEGRRNPFQSALASHDW